MSNILKEALKSLREDFNDDEEIINNDYDSYEDFIKFAESKLPYEARAKYIDMNPNNNELLWVCQEECDINDFQNLMKAFVEYYNKDDVDGKTYSVIMKSRSYPGDGNFIKRVVSFKDGNFTIAEEEPILIVEGRVELYHYVDEDGEEGDAGEHYFKIYSPEDDISGLGKTIGEAKENFLDELERYNAYVDTDEGYSVSDNVIKLDYKTDDYSIDEYVKEIENGKSPEELFNYYDNLDDLDNVIEIGKYETYEALDD